MQLSKKPNTFCCFFIAFLESTCNFEHFELYSLNISEIINSERNEAMHNYGENKAVIQGRLINDRLLAIYSTDTAVV